MPTWWRRAPVAQRPLIAVNWSGEAWTASRQLHFGDAARRRVEVLADDGALLAERLDRAVQDDG